MCMHETEKAKTWKGAEERKRPPMLPKINIELIGIC